MRATQTSIAWSSRMLRRFSGGAASAAAARRRAALGGSEAFDACVVTAEADTGIVRVMPEAFPHFASRTTGHAGAPRVITCHISGPRRAPRPRAEVHFPHRQI